MELMNNPVCENRGAVDIFRFPIGEKGGHGYFYTLGLYFDTW